jgi:hypothetical protein
MPDTILPSDNIWVHGDARGLGAAIVAAISRASIVDTSVPSWGWQGGSKEDNVADLRALVYASMFLFDELSMRPPKTIASYDVPGIGASPGTVVSARSLSTEFSSPQRATWVVTATQRTWSLLYDRLTKMGVGDPEEAWTTAEGALQIFTNGGLPPIAIPAAAPVDVSGGGWVLPGIGIVVGALAVCFIIDKSFALWDAEMRRQADSAALVQTQAAVIQVLRIHADAEKAAGGERPLSQAELDVLNRLAAQQVEYQKKTAAGPPYPTTFPTGSELTDTVKSTTNIGLIIVAVIAAVLLLKK